MYAKKFSSWFADAIETLCEKYGYKTVAAVTFTFLLLLFGDILLPLLWHVLHNLVEVVEWGIEHFLESAFDLTPRQAEITVFYLGISVAAYALWRLLYKAYSRGRQSYNACLITWRGLPGLAKITALLRISLVFVSFAVIMILFS